MDVTLPDGQVLKGVPDGTPREKIAGRLRASGHDVPDSWVREETPEPRKFGILDRVSSAVESVAQPAIAAVVNPLVAGAGNVVGAAKTVMSGKYGTPEGISEGQKAADEFSQKHSYTPSNETARNVLEAVGTIADKTKMAGLNPADGVMAAAAFKSAPINAIASRAVKALKDAPETAMVQSAAGAPRAAAHAMVLPEVRQLAQKATDLGISIRPDMLTDNKFMRMIGEALEKVPLSGSKADQRQIGFNRAIMSQIGVDTRTGVKRLTPDVFDKAITASGQTIGDISAKAPVRMDPAALEKHVHETDAFETGDVAKIVKSYVDEINSKAQGGTMDGEAFRKINSKIGRQLRTTSNGDLKNALGDLQDTLHDGLEASRSGEDLAALQQARQRYAISKSIEPLVAKSKNGDVSPTGLMGVVTSDSAKKSMMARGKSGEIGTLARIGQAFLKEPDSSGTTERAVAYGMLGGGAAIEPHSAAGIYGAANAYNRLGPLVTRMILADKKPTGAVAGRGGGLLDGLDGGPPTRPPAPAGSATPMLERLSRGVSGIAKKISGPAEASGDAELIADIRRLQKVGDSRIDGLLEAAAVYGSKGSKQQAMKMIEQARLISLLIATGKMGVKK